MKSIYSLIFFILFAAFTSCTSTPGASSDNKIITVSILPQKTILLAIAGDKFAINVLIP